jgi:thymidylate synthase
MEEYLGVVEHVLSESTHKPNRTGVDTVASFSEQYTVDLSDGFPLLTTKRMDGFRWNSLIHEFLWYLSGEEHIRTLQEHTSIWDAWADGEGHLDTAYGRFWRRYPIPDSGLPGETWPEDSHRWVTDEGTFDQIAYAMDMLRENPQSRRIVVNAWHPANAAVSTLPPCHYSFVFNVQGDKVNLHLTQRSGDIALGVPFNLAAYALLANVVAGRVGLEVGTFAHSIVDAHVYCGTGARAAWYAENLGMLQERLQQAGDRAAYDEVRTWLTETAPPEAEGDEGKDHVPGLLEQLTRKPRARPSIDIADVPLDDLTADDITLQDYDAAPGLSFAVAE